MARLPKSLPPPPLRCSDVGEPQTVQQVRELLDRHNLRPRKALGQHFLADPNLVRKIVKDAKLPSGMPVLEIGAGTGTLTAALSAAGHRVLAYEIDRSLAPLLDEVLDGLSVDLRFEDAMEVDFVNVLGQERWALVANLPYNVGTPLLMSLLRSVPAVRRFVVMVQREVADRIVAEPGSKQYGIPSVVTALHSRRLDWFRVPPQVFVPPPAVASAVVVLERKPAPPQAERAIELAQAAFGQRRKMLRASLRSEVEDPISVLERAGIDPTRRAESLQPAEFVEIAVAEQS